MMRGRHLNREVGPMGRRVNWEAVAWLASA